MPEVGTDTATTLGQTQAEVAPEASDTAPLSPDPTESAPETTITDLLKRLEEVEVTSETRVKGLQRELTKSQQEAARVRKELLEVKESQAAIEPFTTEMMDEGAREAAEFRRQATRSKTAQEEAGNIQLVAYFKDLEETLVESGAMEADLDLRAELKNGNWVGAYTRLRELSPNLDFGDDKTPPEEAMARGQKSAYKMAQKAREAKMTAGIEARLKAVEEALAEKNAEIALLHAQETAPLVGPGGAASTDENFLLAYANGTNNDHVRAKKLLGLK